jgi:hypothetical protein
MYLSNLRLGVEKMGQEVVAGEAGGHVRGRDLQQLLHVHVLKRDPESEFLDDILTKVLRVFSLLITVTSELIKNKIKFSSYIRKFRWERLESQI